MVGTTGRLAFRLPENVIPSYLYEFYSPTNCLKFNKQV